MEKAHEKPERGAKHGHGRTLLGCKSNYHGFGSLLRRVVVEKFKCWNIGDITRTECSNEDRGKSEEEEERFVWSWEVGE